MQTTTYTKESRKVVFDRMKEYVQAPVEEGLISRDDANTIFKKVFESQALRDTALMPMKMQSLVSLFGGFCFYPERESMIQARWEDGVDDSCVTEWPVHGTKWVVAIENLYQDEQDYISPETGEVYDREDSWVHFISIYPREES